MNTGEFHDDEEPTPVIWCDICGWGDTVLNDGFPDDPFHFCHRHKADEVLNFIMTDIEGYPFDD